MKVKLYRGICVPKLELSTVVDNIYTNGMQGNEGTWKPSVPNVSEIASQVEEMFHIDDLSRDSIFGNAMNNGIYATASKNTALYYATKHNRSIENDSPILIEFEVDISSIYIDGRDLLYTVFQSLKCHEDNQSKLEKLISIFGCSIERYFNSAVHASGLEYKLAMANLACFDQRNVKEHMLNTTTMKGRCGTVFQSAFVVQAPVLSTDIKSCSTMELGSYIPPKVDVTLDKLLY
ncbi:TPA: hypothetical protein KDY51_004832 [Vibrio parahaemolyticus]|nr:hypothetical protein [Vibrio parahaemolyticus]